MAVVATTPSTLDAFFRKHLEVLSREFDITLIYGSGSFPEVSRLSTSIIELPFSRRGGLLKDIRALVRLYFSLRREKFALVLSVTPKAGLLATLACFATRTTQIHWFTGQVWVTRKGALRDILKIADKVIGRLASKVLVDSHSQKKFLVETSVLSPEKGHVLLAGSISGVDLDRFRNFPELRRQSRQEMGIEECSFVICFIGRLNKDKGVADLARAISLVREEVQSVWIGEDEGEFRALVSELIGNRNLPPIFVESSRTPERWMAAADALCLPSYREGFGTSVIEGASMGLPAIASKIYGLNDTIEPNETGVYFEVGNIPQLCASLQFMASFPDERRSMGLAAERRVRERFDATNVSEALRAFVVATLRDTNLSKPRRLFRS